MRYSLSRIFLILIATLCVLLRFAPPASAQSYPVYETDTALSRITLLYNEGDWDSALDRLHSYLKTFEESSSHIPPEKGAYAYMMLGNVHLNFQNHANADKFYTRGLQIAEKVGLPDLQFKLLGNLAAANVALGNEERARRYTSRMSMIEGVDPHTRELNTLLVSAFVERHFGDWRKSVTLLKRSLKIIRPDGLEGKKVVTPLSEISEMYESNGMTDSTLHYLKPYEEAARKYGMSNMLVDIQQLYMRVYIRRGEADKALMYQDRYRHLQDSLLNTATYLKSVREFDKDFEAITDSRMQMLRFTISRQKFTLMLVTGILGLAIVIAAVIWVQKRRLRASWLQLYDKNRELLLSRQALSRKTGEEARCDNENDAGECKEEEADEEPRAEERSLLRDRIVAIMNDRDAWCDPDFSLTRLSDLVGSNTRYVSQVINDSFGMNFRSYVNQYRVREAMLRISDKERFGHLTIQGIAESVGFRSRTNFIAAFKKETGLTPSIYMKMDDIRQHEPRPGASDDDPEADADPQE